MSTGARPPRIEVAGVWLDALTEDGVVDVVRSAWKSNLGGSIFPVNVDVARAAAQNSALPALLARGSLVLADGMPLVWAARLQGDELPERVSGSSLMLALGEAAEADGKAIYLLGGAPGVPERAAAALASRFPGLSIAGTLSPEFGFDQRETGVRGTMTAVASAVPDLVFVGLGFPRQERLIERLRQELPGTWFLACGGGIAMAAGDVPRASPAVQQLGLEWAHRLAHEPKRLARRYLRDDLPFAFKMFVQALRHRSKRRFV